MRPKSTAKEETRKSPSSETPRVRFSAEATHTASLSQARASPSPTSCPHTCGCRTRVIMRRAPKRRRYTTDEGLQSQREAQEHACAEGPEAEEEDTSSSSSSCSSSSSSSSCSCSCSCSSSSSSSSCSCSSCSCSCSCSSSTSSSSSSSASSSSSSSSFSSSLSSFSSFSFGG